MAEAHEASVRPVNKRGAARLAAVQALYQMDMAGSDVLKTIAEFETHRLGQEVDGQAYLPADATFFRALVSGVVEFQLVLDPAIDGALLDGWPLARIDTTMRQTLRAGLFELQHRSDIPGRVIIAEYVDVARAFFSDGEEPKVVNAILDRLGRAVRPTEFGERGA